MTQLISKINEDTAIPLKVVVPVVMAIFGATWFLSAKMSSMESKIDGAWSKGQMEVWTSRLQKNNPALNVPEASQVVVVAAVKN